MEKRILKILFNKAGGNASKNSYAYKMSIPPKWIKEMGIDMENREVVAGFDGERIIIKKREEDD